MVYHIIMSIAVLWGRHLCEGLPLWALQKSQAGQINQS